MPLPRRRVLVVSSIYFDSAIWKLSSSMWMAGLGYWTPALQPWDAWVTLPWTLDNEWIARAAGYVTLAFELAFPVLVWPRRTRWLMLLIGLGLHIGVGTVIPLPLFGALMIAFLAGLLPPWWFRAPAVDRSSHEPLASDAVAWRFRGAVAFFAVFAVFFSAAMVEPMSVLVRSGIGGVDGPKRRSIPATFDGSLIQAYRGVMQAGYRFAGFRTHPIFLDGQFVDYTHQTRLVYRGPCIPTLASADLSLPAARSAVLDREAGPGRRFYALNQNRLWLAWTYRMVRPRLPVARVESKLRRFLQYWAVRAELDLERGYIAVEQRAIELPVDRWQRGVRERNERSEWREVGRFYGPASEMTATWSDPCWRR